MRRIKVVTKNPYLWQKIRLLLADDAITELGDLFSETDDLCFWDIDSMGASPFSEKILTVGKDENVALALPLSFERIKRAALKTTVKPPLTLEGRVCSFKGEKIRLTELEASLLSLLIEANGEYVSREEILDRIWRNDADAGIINVYIHYLREKLEKGEKIILSSRKQGYKIDGKFLEDVNND